MAMHLLYETASGYALYETHGVHNLGQNPEAVGNFVSDVGRFGRIVQMTAFHPFQSELNSLNEIKAVNEGHMSDELRSFLESNLKVKGGNKFILGVSDPKLGACIFEATKIPCQSDEIVHELLRGVREHFDKFLNGLKHGELAKAQLGLANIYSREKVNYNDVDDMVIEAINLLDTLDKVIDPFAMRVREWYSWHFPELVEIVNDIFLYARVSNIIEDKSKLCEEHVPMLVEILGNEETAKEVVEAGKTSTGQDLSPGDLINVKTFSQRVIDLADHRKKLFDYLVEKMNKFAPSLSALVGEVVGARLISRAGSLSNLVTLPGSTLQTLGADKAMSKALKTGGKTPKYGLIFHSSFIRRATGKNKGRIARLLACKCSLAARADYFKDSSDSSRVYGEELREQVEKLLEKIEREIKAVEVSEKRKTEEYMDEKEEEDESKNKKSKSDEEVMTDKDSNDDDYVIV